MLNKNIFNLNEQGVSIPKTEDGRIIFVLPYQNYYMIGKNK